MADVPSSTSEPPDAPEQRIATQYAMLEGTESAVLVPTGARATSAALLALLRSGDHLVASAWSVDDTTTQLQAELSAQGIDVTLVDPSALRTWRTALRQNTRAIFVQTPAGAADRTIDLRPASYVTKELGIALVVDATHTTATASRAIEQGADVIIRSAAEVTTGVICGTASYVDEVRRQLHR